MSNRKETLWNQEVPPKTIIIVLIIVGVFLYSWISDLIPDPEQPLTAAEQQAREEREAERAIERERKNKEVDAIIACQRLLERSLHNPDSLKWDSILERKVINTGTRIRVSHGYSADNLLGGRRRGVVTCLFDQDNTLIDHAIIER